MRRAILMALLALMLPAAALANRTVDFGNTGGVLQGSDAGLTLTGSTLTAVNGLFGRGLVTGNLGKVEFSTGGLVSGSLKFGGTFAAGGTFTIVGDGRKGIPNAVLFSGTFSSPVTWTLVTLPDGTHNYTLTGTLSGTFIPGYPATGVTIQLTINTGKGYFDGKVKLASGDSSIVVPEPGTLGLLGTGLLAIAGLVRRRKRGS
jgi:hypothetical protein